MNDDKRNEGGALNHRLEFRHCANEEQRTELAPALVCEHCSHQTTAYVYRRELGGDDRGQGVVTTDAYTHLKQVSRHSHFRALVNSQFHAIL